MKKLATLAIAVLTLTACKNNSKKDTVIDMRSGEGNASAMNGKEIGQSSDWEFLFDGSNFDQWRGYGTDEMYAEWSIDGDAMKFTPGKEGGKNIISKSTYENFVLSLEWKISEGGNSGIFWGVHESPEFKEAYETGPEIQVLDDAKHPDSFVAEGTHKAGSLYDMIKRPDGLINPAGEWNKVELEVNHKTNLAKLKLNGKDAFTFPVHGDKWDAMVADSKFNGWKGFGKFKNGHIGLQDHSDVVWYRNIKIKRLD
jgi:hypothetical protein